MKAVTKRGIAAVRSALARTRWMAGKLRMILPGQIGLDPRAQRLARHVDVEDLDHRNRRAGMDAVPMRIGLIVGGRQAGFLLKLARRRCLRISSAPSLISSRSGVPDGK